MLLRNPRIPADTHGIVYTPEEIVDLMCASVAEAPERKFGKSLCDGDVYILDPCTGTGNFIVNLVNRIPKRDLPRMFRRQLFANDAYLAGRPPCSPYLSQESTK